MPKVTIYTQVYNTKSYVEQCISSVLSQTYTDFEYLLLDNGCTDGSSAIIDRYAKADRRIRLIRFEENCRGQRLLLTTKYAVGKYYAVIDSDDWWEPDYLERLISFLEKENLDLAVTGTVQHIEETSSDQIMRKLKHSVVLTQKEFAQKYPQIWAFPSTNWATIMKMDIVRTIAEWDATQPKYGYGGDTIVMLKYIEHCSRIGIDNSALYHYRIHSKSISYQYDPRRFDGNVAYYEQIKGFLELHQTYDPPKQEWLKRVHLASMTATLEVLGSAHITEEKRLAECARIVKHPLTAIALTNDSATECSQFYSSMWKIVFSFLAGYNDTDTENLYAVLHVLAPRCCEVARARNLELIVRETSLRNVLQRDDWEQLVCQLMELIVQKRYSKQYELGQMLNALIPPKTPLAGIIDTRFFREYANICMLVLCENYSVALEQMTGLLLGKKKLYTLETYLNLYLSLSALEEQVPAFIFGKLQLAWLYLRQGRREESRAVAEELAEMGLESEELTELRRTLGEGP